MTPLKTRLRLAFVAICAAAAFATPAFAGSIEEFPTGWRLQNYNGAYVVVFFTGASDCTMGSIRMTGTADDVNRFWSTVLAAKLANRKLGVIYSGGGSSCVVDSFYIQS
ncbi:hypothetical protein [Caulobacter sp. LARHSG274]